MCTEFDACAPMSPKLHDNTSSVIEQPCFSGSIDHAMPVPVGNASFIVTLFAVPGPPFSTMIVNPIASPALTTAASASFVIVKLGASTTIFTVVDAALPVIEAAGGRAFLLFTTLRALARARERLEQAFRDRGLDYPLLVQGEGSKTELLERFRALGNAVLLGSASFWEGVDVPGPALSLVVIDKLPFAPPDDPLLAARLNRLKADGGNPFRDY